MPRNNLTPYIEGFKVKPKTIDTFGVVTFTDGTNNITPNQLQCEAYGYKYNSTTGTCEAFTYSNQVATTSQNIDNKILGDEIKTNGTTTNAHIIGEKHNLSGVNRNILVAGRENKVQDRMRNATALGVNANITRQSEFAVGGGLNTVVNGDLTTYSDRQFSVVNLSGCTDDNSNTNLTVNGLPGTDYINVKNNCILGYEIYITRLEVGGASGTAGNFSYRNQKGVIRINDSYSMTITVGFDRNIGKLGVNGTFAMIDTSTTDVKSVSIQVSDRNNVHNIWSATVYLHEIISTSVTF